jgi:PEP-CTERM motif
MNSVHHSILTRTLMASVASLAFMMIGAPGVRAETVFVQGANGANAVDGDPDVPATGGESATATAGSMQPVTDPGNSASATGGNGGNGGNDFGNGTGAPGGAATATAATTAISGSAEADATAIGGNGGNFGAGGSSFGNDGNGGFANATSTAVTSGSGDASSSANASGGAMGSGDFGFAGGAGASADAVAAGGGKATATAFAMGGPCNGICAPFNAASATSSAETVNGAMADAQSIAIPGEGSNAPGQASSSAKTSFAGVSVQSSALATTGNSLNGSGTPPEASTNAIAQGGSGQSPVNPGQFDGLTFSTALPNTAYATTLIGSASNVADALLGPDDTVFGSAILEGSGGSSTFAFSFRGDLILGVITGGFFSITANGTDILSEDVGDNSIINLGSILGPNIDLTIEGDGVFAFGGAVPEPSTWALMLLGFAGLGYAGYRKGSALSLG